MLSSSSNALKMSEDALRQKQQLLAKEMGMFEQKLKDYRRHAENQIRDYDQAANAAQRRMELERQKAEQELMTHYRKVESLLDVNHHVKMSSKQQELSELELEETSLDLCEAARRLYDPKKLLDAIKPIMANAEDHRALAKLFNSTVDALPTWLAMVNAAVEPGKKDANELIKAVDEFECQYGVFKQQNDQVQAKKADLDDLVKKEELNNNEIVKTAKQWNQQNDAIKSELSRLEPAVTYSRQSLSDQLYQLMAICEGQVRHGNNFVMLGQERIKIYVDGKKLFEELIELYKQQEKEQKALIAKANGFADVASRIQRALSNISGADIGSFISGLVQDLGI